MDNTMIEKTVKALRHNHFEVFQAENTEQAREIFFRDILPTLTIETVSWDCNSPDRICNVWSITEKSYPAGRIKVILIHQELGL